MAEKQKPEIVQMYFDPLDAALVRSNEKEWIDSGSGNQFKVLRISKETGAWSALIKAPKGQINQAHTHLGPADFYVLSGQIDYRGGSARAGNFIYEPAGAVHEATSHPVETIYLANVYGPVASRQGRHDCGRARLARGQGDGRRGGEEAALILIGAVRFARRR